VTTRKLLIILGIYFGSLFLAACSKVVVQDAKIKAHWIKAGEPAPFEGILLNDYTYYKMRVKLDECRGKTD